MTQSVTFTPYQIHQEPGFVVIHKADAVEGKVLVACTDAETESPIGDIPGLRDALHFLENWD